MPSATLAARPTATASQVSASTSRAVTPAAASHWPASAVGRNPSPIATPMTRATPTSVRTRALTTCPFSTEAGEIAMVRNLPMMPSVESRLTDGGDRAPVRGGHHDDPGHDIVDVRDVRAGPEARLQRAEDADEQQQQQHGHDHRSDQRHRVAQHVPEAAPRHRRRVPHGKGQGCHRAFSISGVASAVGWPVRAKKTSSRSGVCTETLVDLGRRVAEPVQQRPHRDRAAVAGNLQRQRVIVAERAAEGSCRPRRAP